MTRRGRLAFTLIEMLVVVLFTGLVLTFAANFYLDISVASRAALERTVDLRRATSVLDRMTRDLEAAALVKTPSGVDPLELPWRFLAQSSGRGAGSDRIKFQARNHRPRAALGHESDLVQIAYWLAPAEDGESQDLMRWVSTQPPEGPLLDSFPRRDDPGVEVLASHVAAFGIRLQNAEGAWSDAWDSWSPAQPSELPVAAEVSVALLPEQPPADELEPEPPVAYLRPVLLPLRPLDLEETLSGEAEAEEEEDEELACVTVSECVSRNQASVEQYLVRNPQFRAVLESMGEQCWVDHAASLPLAVTNCR